MTLSHLNPATHRFSVFLILFVVCLCTWCFSSYAQIPYLDPLPWFAQPDSAKSRFLDVYYDYFEDEKSQWISNRLGLNGFMRAGQRGLFFVRANVLFFHSDGLRVLDRWPNLAGESVPEGWPNENRSVGFASPELGLLGPVRIPLLGRCRWGFVAGLPIGRDQLYPFASAAFALRLALRKDFDLAALRLSLVAGGLLHMDSTRDVLDPSAFPDGHWFTAALSWRSGARRWLNLILSDDGRESRHSTRLALQWWIPSGRLNIFGLSVVRELAGFTNRPFLTQITLTWRLVSPAGTEIAGSETAETTP